MRWCWRVSVQVSYTRHPLRRMHVPNIAYRWDVRCPPVWQPGMSWLSPVPPYRWMWRWVLLVGAGHVDVDAGVGVVVVGGWGIWVFVWDVCWVFVDVNVIVVVRRNLIFSVHKMTTMTFVFVAVAVEAIPFSHGLWNNRHEFADRGKIDFEIFRNRSKIHPFSNRWIIWIFLDSSQHQHQRQWHVGFFSWNVSIFFSWNSQQQ